MSDENIYVQALKKDNAELTKQNYDLMKKYIVKTSDPVINDVIDRIFKRHQQGMEKFKRTMADNSKSIPEWIEESIQEKIDDICYMSTLKDRIVEREEKLLKENDRLIDELTISELVQGKMTTEIDNLKKETDILKDDLTIKDLEMGKMMNKINELEKQNGKKT